MVRELIPMIDGAYRTTADREHRAIAGLSRGAGQALQIGLTNLDLFSYLGAFSAGALANLDVKTSYRGVFADAAAFNHRVHLLWIGAGTAEPGHFKSSTAAHMTLEKAGVRSVHFLSQGTAHE